MHGPEDADLVGKLAKLAELHASGALTYVEYAAAKARLLGAVDAPSASEPGPVAWDQEPPPSLADLGIIEAAVFAELNARRPGAPAGRDGLEPSSIAWYTGRDVETVELALQDLVSKGHVASMPRGKYAVTEAGRLAWEQVGAEINEYFDAVRSVSSNPATKDTVVMASDAADPGENNDWLGFVFLVGLALAGYWAWTALSGSGVNDGSRPSVTTGVGTGLDVEVDEVQCDAEFRQCLGLVEIENTSDGPLELFSNDVKLIDARGRRFTPADEFSTELNPGQVSAEIYMWRGPESAAAVVVELSDGQEVRVQIP